MVKPRGIFTRAKQCLARRDVGRKAAANHRSWPFRKISRIDPRVDRYPSKKS